VILFPQRGEAAQRRADHIYSESGYPQERGYSPNAFASTGKFGNYPPGHGRFPTPTRPFDAIMVRSPTDRLCEAEGGMIGLNKNGPWQVREILPPLGIADTSSPGAIAPADWAADRFRFIDRQPGNGCGFVTVPATSVRPRSIS